MTPRSLVARIRDTCRRLVEPLREKPKHRPAGRTRFSILVVDADPRLAARLASSMQVDRDMRAVCDADEALRQARKAPPDLALITVADPRVDGFALDREMRAVCGASTVLVAVTCKIHEEDLGPFDRYLSRPADLSGWHRLFDLSNRRGQTGRQ